VAAPKANVFGIRLLRAFEALQLTPFATKKNPTHSRPTFIEWQARPAGVDSGAPISAIALTAPRAFWTDWYSWELDSGGRGCRLMARLTTFPSHTHFRLGADLVDEAVVVCRFSGFGRASRAAVSEPEIDGDCLVAPDILFPMAPFWIVRNRCLILNWIPNPQVNARACNIDAYQRMPIRVSETYNLVAVYARLQCAEPARLMVADGRVCDRPAQSRVRCAGYTFRFTKRS